MSSAVPMLASKRLSNYKKQNSDGRLTTNQKRAMRRGLRNRAVYINKKRESNNG